MQYLNLAYFLTQFGLINIISLAFTVLNANLLCENLFNGDFCLGKTSRFELGVGCNNIFELACWKFSAVIGANYGFLFTELVFLFANLYSPTIFDLETFVTMLKVVILAPVMALGWRIVINQMKDRDTYIAAMMFMSIYCAIAVFNFATRILVMCQTHKQAKRQMKLPPIPPKLSTINFESNMRMASAPNMTPMPTDPETNNTVNQTQVRFNPAGFVTIENMNH